MVCEIAALATEPRRRAALSSRWSANRKLGHGPAFLKSACKSPKFDNFGGTNDYSLTSALNSRLVLVAKPDKCRTGTQLVPEPFSGS